MPVWPGKCSASDGGPERCALRYRGRLAEEGFPREPRLQVPGLGPSRTRIAAAQTEREVEGALPQLHGTPGGRGTSQQP